MPRVVKQSSPTKCIRCLRLPLPLKTKCFKCSKAFFIKYVVPNKSYSKKNN